MNAENGNFPRGDIRVSDAERDLVVAELSEHFQAGRLTQDEFDDRSGLALRARTGADLSGLFTDLPTQAPVAARPPSGPVPDPFFGPGAPPPRRAGLPVARAIIAFVIVATIASGLFGNHGHSQGAAWVVPVVILVLVFLRLTGRARRR